MSITAASFNIYDILYSNVQNTTNTLTCQLGDASTGTVSTDNAQLWQQVGLASLPSNPSNGSAGQAIVMSSSLMDLIISTRDTRVQGQIGGKFQAGDTFLYAAGPTGTGQPRVALKGNTGTISLYTTFENQPNGIALGITIDAMNDSITIANSIGNGIVIDKTGVHITLTNGDAGMDFFNEDQSIQIMAKGHTQVVGGAILLGTTATVSPANAATIGPTGTFTGAGVGVAPGATLPVAGATTQVVSSRVFIGV